METVLRLLSVTSHSPSCRLLPEIAPIFRCVNRATSSEITRVVSTVGEVLELVLLFEKSSVCTVASLVLRDASTMVGSFPGRAGGFGSSPSGEGTKGNALAGRVLFKI